MKRIVYLVITTMILASCAQKTVKKEEELVKLKKERSELDGKIQKLEIEVTKSQPKAGTPVTVIAVQPELFTSYVEVQSQITGDQNVNATPQMPGIVQRVLVSPGQHVGRGQTLAVLDASAVDQQIGAINAQLELQKSLYDKQQKLWAQNIGTEVQLLSAKATYQSTLKQKQALIAQRNMYSIKSPISGTVDEVNVKVGDAAAPGTPNGIKVVSLDQLKAEAKLGENYLDKVHTGDHVTLVFPDINDSIDTKLSYVSKAVDPVSRAFLVQIRLGSRKNLRPNMSSKMRIINYTNQSAIVVPVSLIQKTAEGDMLYIVDGNKAKAVVVQTGRISNGMVEITGGLSAGDKVITEGYEDLDNGETVVIK